MIAEYLSQAQSHGPPIKLFRSIKYDAAAFVWSCTNWIVDSYSMERILGVVINGVGAVESTPGGCGFGWPSNRVEVDDHGVPRARSMRPSSGTIRQKLRGSGHWTCSMPCASAGDVSQIRVDSSIQVTKSRRLNLWLNNER